MKRKGLIWKIPLGVLGGVLGLFSLTWGTTNAVKYAIYSDFFATREKLGIIPDINNGFTPQGICVNEELKLVFMTGYQKDETQASRIYIKGSDQQRYVEIIDQDDKPFISHNGGISCTKKYIYIADTNCHVLKISLDDVINPNNKQVKILETITLKDEKVGYKNEADFIFSDDEITIVGDFSFQEKGLPCSNPYQTKDGLYTGIAEVYVNDSQGDVSWTKPLKAYSIPDKVQGIAENKHNDILLVTSYSVADSYYQLYKRADMTMIKNGHRGSDLYYLDTPDKILKAPAMLEGLDCTSDGKWISLSEAACDKYVLGKFFFANYFFSFTL